MNKKDFKKGWLTGMAWICIAIGPVLFAIALIPTDNILQSPIKMLSVGIPFIWMILCLYTEVGFKVAKWSFVNSTVSFEEGETEFSEEKRINEWIKRLENA